MGIAGCLVLCFEAASSAFLPLRFAFGCSSHDGCHIPLTLSCACSVDADVDIDGDAAKGFGQKTITFWGSFCLNLNNCMGPAMVKQGKSCFCEGVSV